MDRSHFDGSEFSGPAGATFAGKVLPLLHVARFDVGAGATKVTPINLAIHNAGSAPAAITSRSVGSSLPKRAERSTIPLPTMAPYLAEPSIKKVAMRCAIMRVA